MGNTMSPGMNHPGPGGMMAPQMAQQMQLHSREAHQYRQSMHPLHKGGLGAGGVLNSALPGAGSPSGSDPSFNSGGPQGQAPQFSTGPNARMGQNKPMGMMPPPSPAMNGPPKDQPGSNKDSKVGITNSSNSHPEGSPRNGPNSGQQGQGPNPGQGGTAPATPVPGNMTAPSPSAILGNPPSMNQSSQPSAPPELFSSDFIQSVASSLDEFDPAIFRSDGDINFERDFGQWFNPDDVSATLDLK